MVGTRRRTLLHADEAAVHEDHSEEHVIGTFIAQLGAALKKRDPNRRWKVREWCPVLKIDGQ